MRIGSSAGGRWYGGTYGWAFTFKNPMTGATSHYNRVGRGLIGFGNAYLLIGDRRYIDVWTAMMEKINSHRGGMYGAPGVQLGATTGAYPRMYGDQGWYAFALIWRLHQAGERDRLREVFSKLLMMTILEQHIPGVKPYMMKRRGIFKTSITRVWNHVLTPAQVDEIEYKFKGLEPYLSS